jgi:hypothetical protein
LETNNKEIHLQEKTQAFLAIWHDLLDEGKTDWEKWHTYEHIPERLGISGFLAGRRYMDYNDPEQCCFTMYYQYSNLLLILNALTTQLLGQK